MYARPQHWSGTPTNTSVNGSVRETAGPFTWQPNLRLGLRPGSGRLLLELAGEGAFLSQGSRVCATIGRDYSRGSTASYVLSFPDQGTSASGHCPGELGLSSRQTAGDIFLQ